MKHFELKKGLDLPITGAPGTTIHSGSPVSLVAVIGDDSPGLKPTMEVQVGDKVKTGQLLFTDKKTEGVKYTSPGSGEVVAINRGNKRKFESLVIELDEEEMVSFLKNPDQPLEYYSVEQIRETIIESGLWTSFRTRPFGKVPAVDATPASLFITAMDTEPLAPKPELIIKQAGEDYTNGLKVLKKLLDVPIHYCSENRTIEDNELAEGLTYWSFSGPHPAGLPSTHIHFIDPVHARKMVWHIGYQEVISIGYLFRTGELRTEKIVALTGDGIKAPNLVTTRVGANLAELCKDQLEDGNYRIISGSVLSGRRASAVHGFLGRYHNQVTVLPDSSGRSLLNWAMPGSNRFSVKPVFSSALNKTLKLPFNTAVWGGKRAVYPLGTYEEVMPLDIIPIYLLKTLEVGDTEKSKELGCLELIEEDLALCSFVCPGKNEFAKSLRNVLTTIEIEG